MVLNSTASTAGVNSKEAVTDDTEISSTEDCYPTEQTLAKQSYRTYINNYSIDV